MSNLDEASVLFISELVMDYRRDCPALELLKDKLLIVVNPSYIDHI